jgi:deoxyhypusine synthase
MHQGTPFVDDVKLRKEGIVRIYDILFDYEVLLSTDRFYCQLIAGAEFQQSMGTAEFHHLVGKYLTEKEKALDQHKSVLSVAYQCGIPVYTSSPGDSSIGMNIAAMALKGNKLMIDPNVDVNETTSIVLRAKTTGGKSGVVMFGGGSPKNFVLQTEPQLQEVLGITEKGHDYYLQFTDARPDTGGLSGATPGEAVSWGKVDPEKLPDSVVCYTDTTIAMPLFTAYALAKHEPRPLKRLYEHRREMLEDLRSRYFTK